MEEQAATLQGKSLETPDETRRFVDKGKADIVHLGNVTVGRFVLEPGGEVVRARKADRGTDSCQVRHVGYVLSGRMKVVMDDGAQA
jgi:hypothetical protein